jgi:predicted transcriptional regulator
VTEPRDPTLDVLLDLDGQVLVVDTEGGHWVRFVVTWAPVSAQKPHGLDYSLTLQGPDGERLVGFDNSSGREAEAWRAAGPSASAADDQGLRIPRRGDLACRFLEDSGRCSARTRSDPMTTLRVGIASYEEMKARTMSVARGERRVKADEPKVWFTSTESFAKVLSAGNRDLLRVIAERAPGSLDELAGITGKAKSNLSRTLRTMEGYGLVRLERGDKGRITPKVMHDRVELDLPLAVPRKAS